MYTDYYLILSIQQKTVQSRPMQCYVEIEEVSFNKPKHCLVLNHLKETSIRIVSYFVPQRGAHRSPVEVPRLHFPT